MESSKTIGIMAGIVFIVLLCESSPVETSPGGNCTIEVTRKYANCSSRLLSNIPKNIDHGNIRILHLNNNNITDIDVDAFDDFTILFYLDLDMNNIRDLKLGVFDALENLRYLFLGNNKIVNLPLGLFDALTQLEVLALYINEIVVLHPDIFDALVNLKELEIFDNEITLLPVGLFDSMVKLKKLYIHYNEIVTLHLGLFDALVKLEKLYADGNRITSPSLGLFDSFSHVKELLLDNNEMARLGKGLFDFLERLEHLAIHNNPLISLDTDIFTNLRSLQRLYMPFLCNCSDNQMYVLPYMLYAPFHVKIYVGIWSHTTQWVELTNKCNSTWIKFPECERFEIYNKTANDISTDSTDVYTTDSTDVSTIYTVDVPSTHTENNTDDPSIDTAGITYVVISSIIGAITSGVTMYQILKKLRTVDYIVKQRQVTESDMEKMVQELFSKDFEMTSKRHAIRNEPPVSHIDIVFK